MKDDTEQSTSVEARQSDKASLDRIGRRVAARNIDDGTDSFIIGVEPDEAAVQQRSGDGLRKAAEYVAADLIRYIAREQNGSGWAHKYIEYFRYDNAAYETLADALDELRDALRSRQSNTDERMDS